jgi:anti-anti-sigma factor
VAAVQPHPSVDVAQVGASTYVVAVAGDVGESGAADVKDALYPLAAHRGASVVVDVTMVPFVDAPLLGVLTGAAHLLGRAGGRLSVITRDPRARRLFEDSGLTGLARVEGSLAEAIGGARGL